MTLELGGTPFQSIQYDLHLLLSRLDKIIDRDNRMDISHTRTTGLPVSTNSHRRAEYSRPHGPSLVLSSLSSFVISTDDLFVTHTGLRVFIANPNYSSPVILPGEHIGRLEDIMSDGLDS